VSPYSGSFEFANGELGWMEEQIQTAAIEIDDYTPLGQQPKKLVFHKISQLPSPIPDSSIVKPNSLEIIFFVPYLYPFEQPPYVTY